jgi:AraC-like DNA-binding protein
MIDAHLPPTTIALVALALGAVVSLLLRPRKTDAEVLFAIFCGSVALAMLRPFVAPEAEWLWWTVAIGGSATCNVYWLVSRALFRGDGAVGWPHAAVALGVAVLIVVWRVATRGAPVVEGSMVAAVGALLDLAGSAMLVLAAAEALRGWSASLPAAERRLRLGFVLVFGGCVLAGTVSRALIGEAPGAPTVLAVINSVCASAIVLYTLWALAQRRRGRAVEPGLITPEVESPMPANGHAVTAEDRRLAAAIVHLLEVEGIHRDPELKVADLARRLRSAEHKVSRAITHGLGERNFNQLVNRHRLREACRLLEDPVSSLTVLEISLAAGFASLGPFNRAFKAALGMTPSAWRAARAGARARAPESACDPPRQPA